MRRARAAMELRTFICLSLLANLRVSSGQILGCPEGQWQCDDGHCITDTWRCDGEGDCLDGSDEMDCDASQGSDCPAGQFPCLDSVGCVDMSARCDGKYQCPTGSDEENCPAIEGCLDSDWMCKNRICVPKSVRCNMQNDCGDNSDEEDCDMCDADGARCPDGTCLSPAERCDGEIDCSDGSDEPMTCGRICSMNNGGCSHVCTDEPWGALCACPVGYKLSSNGLVCEDLDECASPFPPCMHRCTNTIGSYHCSCREGFKLTERSECLVSGKGTQLLMVQKNMMGLLNVKSQEFNIIKTSVFDPVAFTFDIIRGWFYWADSRGNIYKSNEDHSWKTFSGEPGIKGLACDWLNGYLFWTSQKAESIYMQSADGMDYTTLLNKNVRPSELVLLPIESLMIWINDGPGDRVTLEKSWMDGSDRSTLTVITAQFAHSLTADVAARRLYWISNTKRSIETVKVDGTGRHSFTGIFNRRLALSLAVFENMFYWVDNKGLWQVPLKQPGRKKFLSKTELPLLAVYHELQQPKGSSVCVNMPCRLCQLTKSNPVGFVCACPYLKVLLPDGTCEYPRFLYATMTTINLLEFQGRESTETQLFTTDEGILSFDLDWYRDWLYWANRTGHLQRTSLTQDKVEFIQTPLPVCLINVDQRTANIYWVSCDQKIIGTTMTGSNYPQQLYRTTKEIRSFYLDWLRGGMFWLEEERIFSMDMMEGKAKELLQMAGGVSGNIAFDLRAGSLLWNSKRAGLTALSLLKERSHQAGRRWNVSGSVVAAFEPFLLSVSDDVMTLWDRRDGSKIQSVTVKGHVLGVINVLGDIQIEPDTPVCNVPSMLCQSSSICIPQVQICDGKRNCPEGDDEEFCVATCSSKEFKCKDNRRCIPRNLVCDGRSHCHDGSDEVGCPTEAAPVTPATVLKCRSGSVLCEDGTECVLYSHVCDGETDCKDGSDEVGCDGPQEITNSEPPTQTLVACHSPSVLCPSSANICISPSQFCNDIKDCPDGFDEKSCVKSCPSKTDFHCTDRRNCVPKSLVCDGISHCHDGSDEVDCPNAPQRNMKCRFGSRLCRDGTACVLFSHICDGERDCQDGSDEEGCGENLSQRGPEEMTTTMPSTTPPCTSPSVLCPGSSICIKPTQMCDGRRDCPDASDEKCVQKCPQTDFRCKDRLRCVPKSQVCDGRSHCNDGSDEVNCQSVAPAPESQTKVLKCGFGSRLCKDRTACVPPSHICDGERDCQDGSDEEGCDVADSDTTTTVKKESPASVEELIQPPTTPPCTSPSVLCPGSSTCIKPTQMCDGRADCPDGFDEKCVKRCPSQTDFLCKDRRSCVPRSQVCDGRSHCNDGSDEVNCQSAALPETPAKVLKCRFGSKKCQDGTGCVLLSHVCDGERDCPDGSDEEACDDAENAPGASVQNEYLTEPPAPTEESTQPPTTPPCTSPSVLCPGSSICIKPTQMCDGRTDCPDGFDEKCVKRCPSQTDFRCKDRRSCVPSSQVCDGRSHCYDGSDELNCESPSPSTNPSKVLKCRFGSRLCRDGTGCVVLNHICDGERDCPDGSDEEDCDDVGNPPAISVQNEVLTKSPVPTEDLIHPPTTPPCTSPSVLCPGSSTCIKPTQMCDGRRDCPDGFDEKCVKRCPSQTDFLCKDRRSCVPRSQVCDGRSHCRDGSDEVNCQRAAPLETPAKTLKCRFGSKLCQDGTECVLLSHICDGEKDCPDGSDEEGCDDAENVPGTSVQNEDFTRPPAPTEESTQPPTTPPCTSPSVLCPGSSICIKPTQLCDGRTDCPDGFDEKCVKRCPSQTDFLCKDRRSCVLKSQVCDGRSHCNDGSDEVNCQRAAPPETQTKLLKCRFGSRLCQDGTGCVLLSHVCDGEKDCQDGSDEEECDVAVTNPLEKDYPNESPDSFKLFTEPPTSPPCTSPSVLCPGSSTCIKPTQMCDGRRDCPDGFDEKCVRRCPSKTDFRCKDRRSCVRSSQVCDGRSHCNDGSDELNCARVPPESPTKVLKCRFGSKLCRDGTACVLLNHICDRERDCLDGSDEEECDDAESNLVISEEDEYRNESPIFPEELTQPPTTPPCTSPSVLCPGTSICIMPTQFCDGRRNCPDGFDEKCVRRCPSRSDFRCKDRRSCVPKSQVCDGRSHCNDGSDEADCPGVALPAAPVNVLKCRMGSKLCRGGTECVLFSHVCDGERDCQDGSDEEGCDSTETSNESPSLNQPSCSFPSVQCPDSFVCINPSQLCDGIRDCPDGSDENCVKKCADRTDFLCKDRRSCVSRRLVCDGRAHCYDGSDEANCQRVSAPAPANVLKCRMGSRLCNDGKECVLFSHVCDGEIDCLDGSDEQGCQETCKEGEFQCAHGKMCIPESEVCDGKPQCRDQSDERDCWEQTKSCEHRCADGKRCIPKKFICDGEQDCLDGSDEVGCDFSLATTMFPPITSTPACVTPSVLCPVSSKCVSQNQLCDGQMDCPDGFDEKDCVVQCENSDDFLCSDQRKCIPRNQVCDGRAHCPDGSDEKECQSATSTTAPNLRSGPLKCRTGFKLCKDGLECVMYSHVCDGEPDCQDGSDEEGCESRCKADEFQCSHGKKCVPQEQVCDGRNDCQDGSDEKSCSVPSEGCHLRCDNKTRCVPQTFLCDGESDCADGSDEENCGSVACAKNQYRCASGHCVSEAFKCDGYPDCRDHSDEMDCPRPPRCPPELRCPNSHECLQKEWLCDGEEDCKDGSDEKNCNSPPAKCRKYQFQCGDSSQCIPLSWRCDGKEDCSNGIDEDKCSHRKCPFHLYQCGSKECLEPRLVCNGLTNCADGSDEGVGCAQRNCSSPSAPMCDHSCVSTPNGPRCFCGAGFRLQSSSKSCVDVDECSSTPGASCKQICQNTRGAYNCLCHPGFYLEPDNKSCKSKDEPLLLASVQSELLILGLHRETLQLLSSVNRPVFSLDYDLAQQRVYWLSPDYQSIRWADMKTSNKGTVIKGVKSDSIAVDWVGKNLYWVDGLVGQILAVKLSNTMMRSQEFTVVLGENLEQPSSLVLLPNKGLMLWSEIGSIPQIERSGMDGSQRKVVVSHDLSWPVSLAYDFLDNRVYWADEKLRCIGSASLDGDNIEILQLAETPSPFSVAVFNDRVFWSDTKRRTIRSADKRTGKDQNVLLKKPGQPFGLKLMHAFSQPVVSNPCEQMRCSHLCLLAPENTAVCRCPKGLLLSQDKITCSLPKESSFILFLSHDMVYQVYLRSMHHDGIALKKMPNGRDFALPGITEALGLDFSVSQLLLYVAHSKHGSVDVLKLSSSKSRPKLVLAGQILKLQGEDAVTALAVDWVTSNLYWSSKAKPDIHVTSPSDGYTTSLLQRSLVGIATIALHPPSGRLCYTAMVITGAKSQTEVDCAWMDGRNKVVLWKKLSIPISLVFSNDGTRIYWADTGEGVISSIGVDGSGYKEYKTGPNLLVSFTFIENVFFWVTLEKDISKLWFSDGLQPKQLWFQTKTNVVEIRSYNNDSQSGSNSCSPKNGECAHLCLPYPGGHTCKCGRGFYSANGTFCNPLPSCPTGEESCFDGSECVSSNKFCDGRVDCPDQSDEQDCPNLDSALSRTKISDDQSSQSFSLHPDTQNSVLSDKDSDSCNLKHCNGHGSCITDGKATRCQCLPGYKGEFCEEQSRRSHPAVIMVAFCLVAAVIVAVFVFSKRKGWKYFSRSAEKETLMDHMVLPEQDSDSEELESPVDVKNPLQPLKSVQLE